MVKFKAKIKDERLLVRAKLIFGSTLNKEKLDAFSGIYIRGFLKAKRVKKNIIEYAGPVGVSLEQRLKKPISKYDFFFIMEQIVDTTIKLQNNDLSLDNVIWDIHHVYINENTKELQFIYIPLEKYYEESNVIAFMESIIYVVTPMEEQDREYISQFAFFLSALRVFDADKIEKYIKRVDRKVVNTIKRHHIGQSGYMTDKQKDYYAHYSAKEDEEDEDATGLMDEGATGLLHEEATGLMDEEATGLLHEEATGLMDEDATGLLDDGSTMSLEDEDVTSLLQQGNGEVYSSESGQGNIHYPTLHRVLTDEKISVNKTVFRIGKEQSYVDYFVSNNPTISRSHADIITRGQRYYIIDLNSKNKSYVNDRVLPIQEEVEIFDGDCLKLSNEEFVFHT